MTRPALMWPVATASTEYQPALPMARGSVSDAVIEGLRREPGRVLRPSITQLDVLEDDDPARTDVLLRAALRILPGGVGWVGMVTRSVGTRRPTELHARKPFRGGSSKRR